MNSRANPCEIESETFEVHFNGFEGLPARKGEDSSKSNNFTCFGHQWAIELYPGGDSLSDDGMVSLFLSHESTDERIEQVSACFTVKGPGSQYSASYHFSSVKRFEPKEMDDAPNNLHRWGRRNFAKRSVLIDTLTAGALVFVVQMMRLEDLANAQSQLFIPTNPLGKNILKKFMDEKSADVVFEVCSEDVGKERTKRAKPSPTTAFYAHRLIMEECSPFFSELCNSTEGLTPISINDVKPEIFHIMLYYTYGGRVADDDLKVHAKDIIDSADIFEMASLKLEAEACYVRSTELTAENVMDNLSYADAKNCPLLKEAAMEFVAKNGGKVAKEVLKRGIHVSGDIFADFLFAMERGQNGGLKAKSDDDFSLMCVDDLRRKLDKKGLDVDGSREVMIAALKENP